jgi:hypothetical protein
LPGRGCGSEFGGRNWKSPSFDDFAGHDFASFGFDSGPTRSGKIIEGKIMVSFGIGATTIRPLMELMREELKRL